MPGARPIVTRKVRPYGAREACYTGRRFSWRRNAMRLTKASTLMLVTIVLRAMPTAAAECDRVCLRGIVTQYLDAFVAHQPNAAFAPNFKYVQDAIDTKPGEGLWKEAAKLRPYRIDVLDVRLGMAGTMTLVDVDGGP